jgi:hypothetical protein
MRLNRILRAAGATLILTATAGCASTRSASVGTDATNYSIDATNSTGQTVTVYWSDGGEPRMLGSVGPNATERFIIVTRNPSVSITATGGNPSRTRGPYQVTLVANSPQRVTIR